MKAELKMGISSGRDNRKLFAAVYERFFHGRPASMALIDNNEFSFSIETLEFSYKNEIYLDFEGYGYLVLKRDAIVLAGINSYTINPPEILSALETLPFDIASFGSLFPQWHFPDQPYHAPSFSDFHLPHGWACAFKGEGFKRLVSRRWLDYGPWKQYDGREGAQLIQFHQLDTDAGTALHQAREGHIKMGISDEGGFIQGNYVYQYDNQGMYDPAQKLLKVIVHGNNISNRQMLDACAARLYQPLAPSMHLDNIAYIFIEEARARQQLHELWLRGLECRAIINGKEIRLDLDYHPDPAKPQWTFK